MSFRDLVMGDIGADAVRSQAQPPGPVEGQVDLGMPVPDDAAAGGVLEKLKTAAKVAAFPITFTVEGLRRTEDLFQVGLLTAMGKIPLNEFDDYAKGVLNGSREITGRDFLELSFGQEWRAALDKIPLIPGWVKEVTDPASPHYTQKLPRASLGGLMDFFTEAAISPFAAVGMMPRALVTATKLDVVTRAVTLPLTYPLRLMGRAVFSPKTPWGFMVMRLRDPDAVLPAIMANALKLNGKELEDLAVGWGERLSKIGKDHSLIVGPLGKLLGTSNPNVRNATLWKHLGFRHQTLTAEESAAREAIVREVLVPLKARLLASQANLKGMDVIRNWDPDRDMLRPFFMLPKNFLTPASTIQSKTFIERVTAGLPLKPRKLPYNPNALKDENRDVMHSLSWFVGQMERSATLHHWQRGVLGIFGPRAELQGARANPMQLQTLTKQQWLYWNEKVHSMTGHAQTKPHIMFNQLGEEFVANVRNKLTTAAQSNRILALWGKKFGFGPFGDPRMGRTTSITSIIVARQMTALMGGQLASPLKNTSQILNTAAVKGMPATIRGMFKTIDHWSDDAAVLRAARKRAGFSNEFNKLAHDNMWDAAGSTMSRILMAPFNASESFIRGFAFNVRAAEELEKRGVKNLAQWNALSGRDQSRVIARGFLDAQMTNFTYGLAGRSGLMMHPVLRVGLAMQSYSWKQAEFTARLFREDGLAFTRLVALHGWAIETLYHANGVNAESWLGWGFLPPSGKFGEGPAVETLGNLVGLAFASNEDDQKAVGIQVDRLRGGLRELMRAFGDPDKHLGLQAGLGAAATFGLLPIPIVAIGKTSKLVNEFLTGEREAAGGRVWRPISRDEALKSYFLTSHEQVEQNRLRLAETKVRRTYDGVMRKRVNKFVSALQGDDGEEVVRKAAALFDRVEFKVPITANKIQGMFVHDERSITPTLNMVESRLREEVKRRTVGQGVRAMIDSGWVFQVLSAEYIKAALRDLEAGSVRRMK